MPRPTSRPLPSHTPPLPLPQTLVLCYNELTRLEGLEGLGQLRLLDLSHNSLRKVEGALKGLTSLTHLDLASNQVLKLEVS